MSYTVYPYLVDLHEVRRAFGSRDGALVGRIKFRLSAEIARHNQWFADEIEHGAPRVDEALQEIIAGRVDSPAFGFQYGYALKLLCSEIGAILTSGSFRDNRVVWDLPFTLPVIANGPPIPIPPIETFPAIGHLRPEEVQSELRKHSSSGAELHDNTFEQMRLDYLEWLEEAGRTGQGLLGFCY